MRNEFLSVTFIRVIKLIIISGHADCADGSDENPTLCKEYPCPTHAYSCSYGGCIHQEVLCDGVKDCVDGTDEDLNICAAINCIGDECSKFACRYITYHY